MNSFVEVISPGLHSSIQDKGRLGFRKFGVPVSGVMDEQSASLANHLLNNLSGAALMEITLNGPKLLFSAKTLIAICGADISPKLNGEDVSLNKVIPIKKGDVLTFGALRYGTRCYLSVKKGFQTESIMGSYSYFIPITNQNVIKKGDIIPLNDNTEGDSLFASVKIDMSPFNSSTMECDPGPEFDYLDVKEREVIFKTNFTINKDNNRMGYRLSGPLLKYPKGYNMLTSAVLPGTIQLTPSGQLIALMRDCQTTGGYPRILQLMSAGVNRLAQKKTNGLISFQKAKLLN